MMLVFGVVGYLFKKLKYPLAPLVLALVLGDMAETRFRQAMLLSQGSIAIFWSNALVGTHRRRWRSSCCCWPLIGAIRGRSVARRGRGRPDGAARGGARRAWKLRRRGRRRPPMSIAQYIREIGRGKDGARSLNRRRRMT